MLDQEEGIMNALKHGRLAAHVLAAVSITAGFLMINQAQTGESRNSHVSTHGLAVEEYASGIQNDNEATFITGHLSSGTSGSAGPIYLLQQFLMDRKVELLIISRKLNAVTAEHGLGWRGA